MMVLGGSKQFRGIFFLGGLLHLNLNDFRPAQASQSDGLGQVKIILLNRYHFLKVILVDFVTSFVCWLFLCYMGVS